MLVDLVLMRRDGTKLPAADIRAAKPIRGHLVVRTHRRAGQRAPGVEPSSTDAQLLPRPDAVLDVLAELRQARVVRIEGNALVIVGFEHHGHPTMGQLVPQAWWCRIVR